MADDVQLIAGTPLAPATVNQLGITFALFLACSVDFSAVSR
jgi:hypothetical protein